MINDFRTTSAEVLHSAYHHSSRKPVAGPMDSNNGVYRPCRQLGGVIKDTIGIVSLVLFVPGIPADYHSQIVYTFAKRLRT